MNNTNNLECFIYKSKNAPLSEICSEISYKRNVLCYSAEFLKKNPSNYD